MANFKVSQKTKKVYISGTLTEAEKTVVDLWIAKGYEPAIAADTTYKISKENIAIMFKYLKKSGEISKERVNEIEEAFNEKVKTDKFLNAVKWLQEEKEFKVDESELKPVKKNGKPTGQQTGQRKKITDAIKRAKA